ncbi:MAG: HAMP domain-containing sensor histidine kinase [Spirosomataceae bacterium]
MKIRYRIALQFTLVVAFILFVFSAVVYWNAENQRQKNFYDRLQRRASTTARLLVDTREFNAKLLKIIDKNSLAKLPNEEIYVFNYKNELLYTNVELQAEYLTTQFLDQVRLEEKLTLRHRQQDVIGVLFKGQYDRFVVVAAATDLTGEAQMKNLLNTLFIGFSIGILLTVSIAVFFATQALRPIQHINNQISYITAKDLSQRLLLGNNQDEIAELSNNFNQMLQRLEAAFQQQKQFVSHASHELRTPLAALKTEIQVGLSQTHTHQENHEILQHLERDTDRLIALSNGLLQLAKVMDHGSNISFEKVHLEEVLLLAKSQVENSDPTFKVRFDFEQIPDDENSTLVIGNETLLVNVVVNLLINACKYSTQNEVQLLLNFNNTHCIIKVKDNGIGIDAEDLPHIFQPFYRAKNAVTQRGFGVGLSVVQRTVELHNGTIRVNSIPNVGTEFLIEIPHC